MSIWFTQLTAFEPNQLARAAHAYVQAGTGAFESLEAIIQKGRNPRRKAVRERLQARYARLVEMGAPEPMIRATRMEAHPQRYLIEQLELNEFDQVPFWLVAELIQKEARRFEYAGEIQWACADERPEIRQAVDRALCGSSQCEIAGRVWFTDFEHPRSNFQTSQEVAAVQPVLSELNEPSPGRKHLIAIPEYVQRRVMLGPGTLDIFADPYAMDVTQPLFVFGQGAEEVITDIDEDPTSLRDRTLKRAHRQLATLKRFFGKCKSRGWCIVSEERDRG